MDKVSSNISPTPTSRKLPKTLYRGIVGAAVLGGSLCVGSVIFAVNTVGLDWSKAILQYKKDEVVVEPAPKLEILLNKAAADLKLSNSERKLVKLFCSTTDVSEVYGTIKYPYGVLLGLPSILNAESEADYILPKELESGLNSKKMRNKIRKLKEVSVLSDAAKLFVIAEGLVLAKEPDHFIDPSVTSSLCAFAGLLQGVFMSSKFLTPNQINLKSPIYLGSLVLWAAVGLFVAEQTKEQLLKKEICCLSEEYIDGGVEFYEKLQARQKLSKELFGVVLNNYFGSYYLEDLVSRRLSFLRKIQQDFSWHS